MRVLHIYKTSILDSVGGVEQVIHQIAKGISKAGAIVDVFSLTSKNVPRVLEMDGYFSHRARQNFQIFSTGFSASALIRFRQQARSADLIHYHFPWPFMDILHFSKMLKKPSIVTYHSDIVRQKKLLLVYKPLMNAFLKDVDRIVATSPNYLLTSETLNTFKHKTSVIPIGLDENNYKDSSLKTLNFWKEKFGEKFFLFVGVLRYYKGLHNLIFAAVGCDYQFVIVGSGPVEAELKEQVNELGLTNVHFLGFLSDDDKNALLTLCFAVLFPSNLRSEAFGVSLLEGAMYGKPMISSEIGTGTTFININFETGLVVSPDNPNALKAAINYLWENPDEAAAMGLAAKLRFRKYFTADDMVNNYMNLYSNLLDKKINSFSLK